MYFSNWPLYIDVEGKRHPTLDDFQKKYGTKVKYVEEINDNDRVLRQGAPAVRHGQLRAGATCTS